MSTYVSVLGGQVVFYGIIQIDNANPDRGSLYDSRNGRTCSDARIQQPSLKDVRQKLHDEPMNRLMSLSEDSVMALSKELLWMIG